MSLNFSFYWKRKKTVITDIHQKLLNIYRDQKVALITIQGRSIHFDRRESGLSFEPYLTVINR